MLTWFITGASRGLGRAVAMAALDRGDRVVATARFTATLAPLVEHGGENLLALPLDVTDPDQIEETVAEAVERFGPIDVLANNAGGGYFAALEESDEAEARKLLDVNVFGLAAVTVAVLPGMRERRSGRILNLSSAGGIRAFPAVAWYNASKFAVEALSESLAQEVEPLGIKVVIVEPSGIATDWAGSSAVEVPADREIADYDQTAGAIRRMVRAEAGQEPGVPARVAEAMVDVAHDPDPPLRLPLGNFAYDGIFEKFAAVERDIKPREAISRGTDKELDDYRAHDEALKIVGLWTEP
jgi:NAD(P)-dependent dehydrogenase (short-subunit alcohol dehydrogenase family)